MNAMAAAPNDPMSGASDETQLASADAEQPARRGGLSRFSNKERLVLLAATAVVIVGIAAAALNPDRSTASASASPSPSAVTSASSSPGTASAEASVPPTASTSAASVGATGSTSATLTAATVPHASTNGTTKATKKLVAKTTSTTKAPAPAPVFSVGAKVNFGSYAGAPLQWRVLDADGTGLLLLSEYVVSAGAFQSDWEGRNASLYSTSGVRGWLQADFAAAAFDTTQSAALVPHVGGAVGSDRVFLLSAAEVKRYLPKAADRRAAPCAAAGAGKIGISYEALALSGPYASWWLADPASDAFSAQVVKADGTLSSRLVYHADLGVRPAIRVDRGKIGLTLDAGGSRR